MKKILFLTLFFALSFAEPLISCEFTSTPSYYSCGLTLNNPHGFDNFTSIAGEHLRFYNDSMVTIINTAAGTSLNLPKILCETFKNIQRISLNRFNFEFLTLDALGSCKNLQTLNLQENFIQLIDANTFTQNSKLIEVYLGKNNLITLHGDTLKPLEQLKVLFMNENPFLTDFTSDAFEGLQELEELYLENTGLNRLRKDWFDGLRALKVLHLEGNRIQSLPDSVFSGLISLEFLFLHNNRLQVLDINIFNASLPNLSLLFIHTNRLIYIDPNLFDLLPNLYTFDLSNNFCINQRFFDFSNNLESNLKFFAKCVENFEETVRASSPTCRFRVHQSWGYTCEFIGVDYDERSFRIIAEHPPGLSDSDVTSVIFTSSRLASIPPEIFDKFANLNFLEARNANLKKLSLSNCHNNLKSINLSENSIRNFNSDEFKACGGLEAIYLNGNGLTKIKPCVSVLRSSNKNLTKISLLNNECVDGVFEGLNVRPEEADHGLRRCFAMWHLM